MTRMVARITESIFIYTFVHMYSTYVLCKHTLNSGWESSGEANLVRCRADVHNAGVCTGLQHVVHEQVGQEEVAQVIGASLHLKTVRGDSEGAAEAGKGA